MSGSNNGHGRDDCPWGCDENHELHALDGTLLGVCPSCVGALGHPFSNDPPTWQDVEGWTEFLRIRNQKVAREHIRQVGRLHYAAERLAGAGLIDATEVEAAGLADSGRAHFELRGIDLSQLRPVRFAWRPFMVKGAYNEILGEEGVGKSTLQAYIAAGVTRGTLPGDLEGQPMDVLFIGADEDDWQEAVGPRLHAAGADLDRVVELHSHGGEPFNIVAHADHLDRLLGERDFGLIVVEQVLDVLPPLRNPNDPTAIRQATKPFRATLRRRGVTGLAARHVNKAEATSYRQAGQGSVQFGALARSGFMVALHPTDPTRRVMVMGKANYSAKVSMSFELAVVTFWLNDYVFSVSLADDFQSEEIDMADVLAGDGRRSRARQERDERIASVREALTEAAQSVRALAETTGISKSAVQRILDDHLLPAGEARHTEAGWVSHCPTSLGTGTVGQSPQALFSDNAIHGDEDR